MAGNTVYVQGSYVDVHDNEVVNLSIDKATVNGVDINDKEVHTGTVLRPEGRSVACNPLCTFDEELFHFVHPSVLGGEEWRIHGEVKNLVRRQGIQEICAYLKQMADEKKILLPQSPSVAYAELVRMGMSSSEGFNEKTFQKYYRRG